MLRIPIRRGFTLIELLIVIAILGILTGLLLSAVQNVRGAALRISCTNNLKQIGQAGHLFHEHNGHFPPVHDSPPYLGRNRTVTWPVHLLPYLEQENLWSQTLNAIRTDWNSYHNPPHAGLATVVKVYCCPADGRLTSPITDDKGYTAAYGSYQGVAGSEELNGVMDWMNGTRIADILDGTSNTLFFGEKPPLGKYLHGNWYTIVVPGSDPETGGGMSSLLVKVPAGRIDYCDGPITYGPGRLTNYCDQAHFWSFHSGGANFAFSDGAVRFLRYEVKDLMPALATRAGGEVVSVPD